MRNFLLTAVLFLTASIASAAVVYRDMYENEDYLGEEVFYTTHDLYIYHNSAGMPFVDPNDTPFRKLENISFTSSENSPYKFSLYRDLLGGHGYENTSWSLDLVSGETKDAYLPYSPYYMEGDIVLLAQNTTTGEWWSSGWLMGEGTDYYDSSLGLGYFTHEGNSILFDDGKGNTAKVTFGSPLPTPIITLLIALGFGAAFVMYRNRKQVKA